MSAAYEKRRAARQRARERAFFGETLAAYHARETAPPPTLAEIYSKNRADKTRCPVTPCLLDWKPKSKRSKRKAKK